MSSDEDDVLDGASHRRETSRLSCQMIFHNELSGLTVEIAQAD
jgi:ferredoxin, 2Fe-2S